MSQRKAAFLYSSEFEKYPYPADCPFNTSRAGEVYKTLLTMGLFNRTNTFVAEPHPAERETLENLHTPKYLEVLKDANEGKFDTDALFMGLGNGDCPIFKGMYEYSALACGASLKGAELILKNEAELAFNPWGGLHHAMADKAAGFCYLNDVALACYELAEKGKRVLYMDIDVHHGDGVQAAFYDRNDVMTISFHQDGRTLFPGTGFVDETGAGDGKGYSVNVPLPVGTYDEVYFKAFSEIFPPLCKKYDPDVIVFELGADTLAGDPLAQIYLTNNTYVDIIRRLLSLNKPILMTGGGGYNIANTVRAWSLAWSVFCGADDGHDMNIGMGGVMMESTDWQGGLRDRELIPTEQQRNTVGPIVDDLVEQVKSLIFSIHGI